MKGSQKMNQKGPLGEVNEEFQMEERRKQQMLYESQKNTTVYESSELEQSLLKVNLVLLDGEEMTINITSLDEDPLFEVMKFALTYRINDLALIELLRRRISREIMRFKGNYKQRGITGLGDSRKRSSIDLSSGLGLSQTSNYLKNSFKKSSDFHQIPKKTMTSMTNHSSFSIHTHTSMHGPSHPPNNPSFPKKSSLSNIQNKLLLKTPLPTLTQGDRQEYSILDRRRSSHTLRGNNNNLLGGKGLPGGSVTDRGGYGGNERDRDREASSGNHRPGPQSQPGLSQKGRAQQPVFSQPSLNPQPRKHPTQHTPTPTPPLTPNLANPYEDPSHSNPAQPHQPPTTTTTTATTKTASIPPSRAINEQIHVLKALFDTLDNDKDGLVSTECMDVQALMEEGREMVDGLQEVLADIMHEELEVDFIGFAKMAERKADIKGLVKGWKAKRRG